MAVQVQVCIFSARISLACKSELNTDEVLVYKISFIFVTEHPRVLPVGIIVVALYPVVNYEAISCTRPFLPADFPPPLQSAPNNFANVYC
jgi:hypothetical protein